MNILIKDRKKDYYRDEYAFCEEGCNFDNININLNKVKCNCEIKKEIKTETKFSTSKLFENFYKIDSYSNFKILVCYNLVFSEKLFKKNYGCYILTGIIISFLSSSVINLITNSTKVNEIVKSILEQQAKLSDINKNNQNKKIIDLEGENNCDKKEKMLDDKKDNNNKKTKKKNKKNKKQKKKKKVNSDKNRLNNDININDKIQNNKNILVNTSNRNLINVKNNTNINGYPPKKISNMNIIGNVESNEELEKNGISLFKRKKKKEGTLNVNKHVIKNEEMIDIIIKNIEKEKRKNYFNNEELNSLEYKYALEIDDRTYMQYYWSLLKLNHLIIFTFIANDDYNIFLLKLGFFLISFSLYFAVNAMFFSDDSIHKQYEDKGKYSLIYQIPKILYSTIISALTNVLLKKLSLSQNDILKIKNNSNIDKAKQNSITLKKCLKIKFILFMIVGFIILIFFWYYLSCFCSVFVNTQLALIKDTIISYGFSMLYPFGLNLIPGLLRIPSLKNSDRKIIYIISKITAFI